MEPMMKPGDIVTPRIYGLDSSTDAYFRLWETYGASSGQVTDRIALGEVGLVLEASTWQEVPFVLVLSPRGVMGWISGNNLSKL